MALSLETVYYLGNSFVNAAFDVHRVGTCGYILQAFVDDGLCKYSCCCCAVAGLVIGFRSHLFYHLCAHVCERFLEYHLFCYGHTILCNVRRSEFLANHHIASFWTEGYLNCICKCVSALFHKTAGVAVEFDIFCHNDFGLKNCQNI